MTPQKCALCPLLTHSLVEEVAMFTDSTEEV